MTIKSFIGHIYKESAIRSNRIHYNITNPMRGVLVMGSLGSGKFYFVIHHIIRQHIKKGFSMFIYDFTYNDLNKIANNYFLHHKKSYSVDAHFYLINFSDLSRCNPLYP